ncbi:MAG: KamA family radical SAM protein [Deltaproteobacteria bacterium]|nr:KamA family radical SAM protein [Deltaproteobacteria bacterium]
MPSEKTKHRLLRILDLAPKLKEILLAEDPIDTKREAIRRFLSDLLFATFNDDRTIPPLEWVLTRDAITVFRNILSMRSERLARFSLVKYLNDILNNPPNSDTPTPRASSDFFAEFEHLIKGITGQTGVYPDKIPAYFKYEGARASKLRSADLSRMARVSDKFSSRYACGLDNKIVRKRSVNKSRILKYFNATDLEWKKWAWHTRNIIRDADTLSALVKLTDEEYKAVALAKENKIPFGVTPYYASLMDYDSTSLRDVAVRAQVIPPLNYIEKLIEKKACSEKSLDFMLERDTSPIEGITRRYPKIVILKPIMTCPQICVYCQRNWEIEDVYSQTAVLTKEKLDKALAWIEATPEINEVLITGGDPLLLSNAKMENLLFRLSRIKHVERIRIGTRTPVTIPQRITDSLVRDITHFHHPGKREILIITHFEHPYEITPQSMAAIQKFRRYGIEVYNQLVYTFYNSRKFEASLLRHKLRMIGVTPYYTFNTKGKEETDDYRVPIARLLQEQQEEARLQPGSVRTDEIVFNVPGLGKNYLRAKQHHDVISILPNGRRVYEFHPWEKKLTLADTYIYTDVSIYSYLKRLKSIGENLPDYRTIWYYY